MALVALATSCSGRAGLDLPTGRTCTVQFRRDMLGAAASLPVSAMTDNINGAEVSLAGELVALDGEWLVLRAAGREHWIAREAVLLVSFQAR